MHISIIIPTFRRPDQAQAVASSLLAQLGPQDRIIIVYQVDRPLAITTDPRIETRFLARPGLPQARNAGIRSTASDIVLFLDDDVTPHDGLIEAHRRSYEDSDIGGVAGFVDDPLFDRTSTEPSRFDESTGELIQNFSFGTSKGTISFMGANFSVRRSALMQIGLFDERFRHNALWEEIDLAFRLRAAGWKIWFCAEAPVRHNRASTGGCRDDHGAVYFYHQFANTAYFAGKHAPRRHIRSWIRFWWYRLEYLSRLESQPSRHSTVKVAAALLGSIGGIARFLLNRLKPEWRVLAGLKPVPGNYDFHRDIYAKNVFNLDTEPKMKIAWIYPVDKKCGISFYAESYIHELKSLAEIVPVDTDAIMSDMDACAGTINNCDAVHIQYETSLFLKGSRDYYQPLISRIRIPIFVSLHEIYERFPGVFARDRIQGSGILRLIREFIYDRQHPYVTAYNRHLKGSFGAVRLFVHHPYQRQILINKGINHSLLAVLIHPVSDRCTGEPDPWNDSTVLNLASAGFITPTFDYSLLFSTLERISTPWSFTWIGGVRSPENRDVLDWINKAVLERNWQNRFFVTGWVDESERDRRICNAHIYLALFKQRSSSGSLAIAIGTRSCIVATSIPMVNETVSEFSVATTVERTPATVLRAIENYALDPNLRIRRREACTQYVQAYGFREMALKLKDEYESQYRNSHT